MISKKVEMLINLIATTIVAEQHEYATECWKEEKEFQLDINPNNNYNQYVREIWETDGYLTIDLIGMKINELVKEKQK